MGTNDGTCPQKKSGKNVERYDNMLLCKSCKIARYGNNVDSDDQTLVKPRHSDDRGKLLQQTMYGTLRTMTTKLKCQTTQRMQTTIPTG